MLFDDFNEVELDVAKNDEDSGSSGFSGPFVVYYGWKVFALGHRDSTSFFSTKEKAEKFIKDETLDTKPRKGYLVTLLKEDGFNNERKWKDNYWSQFYENWTWAGKNILQNLENLGVKLNKKYYGVVAWCQDEYAKQNGKKVLNDKGEMGTPLVLYVKSVFKDKEAAMLTAVDAVDDNVDNSNNGWLSDHAIKNGWTEDSLMAQVGNIIQSLKSGTAKPTIAKDYGIAFQDVTWIEENQAF